MSRVKKAVYGVGMSFLQYGLQIILQILLAPLILKVAGKDTLGAYAILMQVVAYGILLDLGFGVAIGRYLAQAFGFDDNGERFTEVFNIGRTFYVFSNLAFGILIFIFSLYVNKFLLVDTVILEQARRSLYLYGAWIVVRAALVIYNYTLTATQNMAASNFIAIVGNVFRLALSLILVFMKTGLVGLILANILAEILISNLHLRYFKKLFPKYKFSWGIRNWALFKEMCSFGTKYWGVNAAVLFFFGTDNIIVGYLYGATAASIYYTTKMPVFLIFQVILKLSENASPAANELFARKNFVALQRAYLRLLRYSMLLAVSLALVIINMNRLLVSVWVKPQQYAGDLMTISLAIFVIIAIINHVNGTMVVVFGNIRYWSILSFATGIVNLGLSFFLGKLLGVQGVAVSIAVTCLPGLIFLYHRSFESLQLSFTRLWREVFKPVLIMNIPLAVLTIIIKPQNLSVTWTVLFSLAGLYALCWAVSVYKFGIDRDERITIGNFLRLRLKIST